MSAFVFTTEYTNDMYIYISIACTKNKIYVYHLISLDFLLDIVDIVIKTFCIIDFGKDRRLFLNLYLHNTSS